MERLKITDFTVSAQGRCVYSSTSEASARFEELGLKSRALLVSMKEHDGRTHLMWANTDNNQLVLLPVFADDVGIDQKAFVGIDVAEVPSMVYHNYHSEDDGGLCYLVLPLNGQVVVRMLTVWSDQELVERYFAFMGIKPKSISMCKMFSIQESSYLTTCWQILYEDSSLVDDYGNIAKYRTYLPVDLADSDVMRISTTKMFTKAVRVDDTFVTNGKIYRLAKDENRKLFLTQELFTPENTETKTDTERKCKVVPFR